jgi:hypothetical protein
MFQVAVALGQFTTRQLFSNRLHAAIVRVGGGECTAD